MIKSVKLAVFLVILTAFSSFAYDSFEDYLKDQTTEYQSYIDEIDREFTSFLKERWIERKGEKPKKLLEKPKPLDVPSARPDEKPVSVKIIPKPEPIKTEPKPETTEPEKKEPVREEPVVKEPVVKEPILKEPVVKPPQKKEPEVSPGYVPYTEAKGLGLSFYGKPLDIPYDKRLKTPAKRPLSSKTIANWWENIASADYKKTDRYFRKTASKMQLGDWGYVNLVERFSAKLVGDAPEQKLLVWFFLNKAGFDTKVGYTKSGRVKLLIPAESQLYGIPFYTFDGKRYYVIDAFGRKSSSEPLYTYKGSYPKADRKLNLAKMNYPDLGFAGFSRELVFKVNGSKYKLQAIANKYAIAFFNNFPQAHLSVYTTAKTPEWIDQTLLPELKKIVSGKNSREAVDILLRFCQTAFDYKTDDQQFGREKFFFAEETIYYPFSDCEDRSVLFAYLVRNLLKLDVIMLDFPGHIAVAVDLGRYNTGAVVSYKGSRYTVTDPTYINAVSGMVMPRYRNSSPKIIEPGL